MQEQYNAWLAKALSDLKSAKKLSKDDDETLDTAAYHTQQCAEKALKAFLAFKNQNIPYTHDLERLLGLCVKHDKEFETWLSDAIDLVPYATYSRYPDDRFFIDREEVIKSIKKTTSIFNFVKKKIETAPFEFTGGGEN